MSQQLVGVNGSLYVLGALSADTVRCRDLDLIGAAAPGAMALDDLTDVTAPAPGVGEALMWDGAAWVNDTPTASGGVPIGGIIMWSGTIATIPATWALCDGTANAPGPDLRDKFVVGATSDDAGVAKSNILGSLSQSGGATGHSHSGHANLTHAGGAVGDHTGFTHGLSVANHPDLTHAALSHAAQTFTHADHSIASASVVVRMERESGDGLCPKKRAPLVVRVDDGRTGPGPCGGDPGSEFSAGPAQPWR